MNKIGLIWDLLDFHNYKDNARQIQEVCVSLGIKEITEESLKSLSPWQAEPLKILLKERIAILERQIKNTEKAMGPNVRLLIKK